MRGLYPSLVFPMLNRLEAERAHEWTLALLETAQSWRPGRRMLRALAGRLPARPVRAFGLTFPNVLGVAAGFDKDARVAAGLALLGFGHVEVGTLTPRGQPGNPRPRILRLPLDRALINSMGFPNEGADAAAARLRALNRKARDFVLGASLGKQKETPLAAAAGDHLAAMAALFQEVDYFTINISSPNTPGLRELHGSGYLSELLKAMFAENEALSRIHGLPGRPILLKIAPDLTWPELDEILKTAADAGAGGIVATNTTVCRDGLIDPNRTAPGGVSGRPLCARNTEIIAYIGRRMGPRLPVVAAGGVFSADDVREKLDAGAVLVQIYTGLVYEGPRLAGRILRELAHGEHR